MLNKLLDKIFVNNKKESLSLLKVYSLDTFLLTFLEKVNNTKYADFQTNKNLVTALSSSFLTRINSILESITDNDEKMKLEYILSEISSELMYQVIGRSDKSADIVLSDIKDALTTTCEANNWDKDVLFRMLRIDMLHSIAAKANPSLQLTSNNQVPKVYYYDWLLEQTELDELAYDLKDKKVIRSVSEFKKLFAPHNGDLNVRINRIELDFVIVLFDQLKENKFIKTKGTRGHFVPLKEYCVDFEKNVLIKNEPKRIKEAIVKNPNRHKALQSKVTVQINNCLKSISTFN